MGLSDGTIHGCLRLKRTNIRRKFHLVFEKGNENLLDILGELVKGQILKKNQIIQGICRKFLGYTKLNQNW